MRQENSGLMLILLLVFGGVLYPQLGGGGKGEGAPSAGQVVGTPGPAATPVPTGYLCDRTADQLIAEYFSVQGEHVESAPSEAAATPSGTPHADEYPTDFLIATVPDPIDSQLGYLFDEYVDAVRRAVVVSGFLPDRYSLPWDCPREARGEPKLNRLHERQAGVMLFRHQTDHRLLAVLLVGETPTTGIQKRALGDALAQIVGRPQDLKWPVRIAGPSFSGSFKSLKLALLQWCSTAKCPVMRPFDIVSGSATAVAPTATTDEQWQIDFRGTVIPMSAQSQVLYDYLRQLGALRENTALLAEAETAYGGTAAKNETLPPDELRPGLMLRFPLHISQVRSAYEKNQLLNKKPQGAPGAPVDPTLHLGLSLEDIGDPRDVVPALKPSMTAIYDDQILATILSTISRENYRYVGILASDARDRLFLARLIHQYCPDVRLFTFGSDLLYVHPQYNADLDGMIVVSTYPLFNQNQSWIAGQPTPGPQPGNRMQFATNGVEGTYNATLKLLGKDISDAAERVLEYSAPRFQPADKKTSRPPVWLSVVGHQGIWPLRFTIIEDLQKTDASQTDDARTYVLEGPTNSAVADLTREVRTVWSVVLWGFGFMCLLNCAGLLFAARGRKSSGWKARLWRTFDRFQSIIALRGVACASCRQTQSAYLLAAFVTLLVAYALLGPIALVPARAWWSGTQWRSAMQPRGGFVLDMVSWSLVPVIFTVQLITSGVIVWWTVMAKRPTSARAKTCAHAKATSVRPMRRRNVLLVLSVFLGLAVALYIAFQGIAEELPRAVLKFERATNAASGVSLVPPTLFLAMGFYLWAMCHVRRLSLLESAGVSLPFEDSAADIDRLSEGLRWILQGPTRLGAVLIAVPVWFVPWFVLMRRFLPTFEGPTFDWLCIVVSFFFLYALTLTFVQFVSLWTQLRALLQRLAAHPVAQAAGRLPARPRGMMSGRFSGIAPTLNDVALWLDHWCVLSRNVSAVAQPLREAVAPELCAQLEKCLADVPQLQARFADERAQLAMDGGQAALALSRTRQGLSHAARVIVQVLEGLAGRRGTGVPEKNALLGKSEVATTVSTLAVFTAETRDPLALWIRLAEEFVMLQVATFFSAQFVQLRNLLSFVTLGVVLLLLAFASYPFQPQQLLMYFVWALIASVAIVSIIVFVQVERDQLLSWISGSDPNKVQFDWQFVSKLLTYGLLPILTLVAAQFPQLGQFLGGIFQVLK